MLNSLGWHHQSEVFFEQFSYFGVCNQFWLVCSKYAQDELRKVVDVISMPLVDVYFQYCKARQRKRLLDKTSVFVDLSLL